MTEGKRRLYYDMVLLQRMAPSTSWEGCKNHLQQLHLLTENSSIHIFRTGISPLYDDAHNQQGGIIMVYANCQLQTFSLLVKSLVQQACPPVVYGVTFARSGGVVVKVWINEYKGHAQCKAWLDTRLCGGGTCVSRPTRAL